MAKDKKKKNKDNGGGKKKGGGRSDGKAGASLRALSQNPIVADIVAAALVSMAAALKDSDKARKLANEAGDELQTLAKSGAKQGGAMWDMALDIGRRTLDALSEQAGAKSKTSKGKGH